MAKKLIPDYVIRRVDIIGKKLHKNKIPPYVSLRVNTLTIYYDPYTDGNVDLCITYKDLDLKRPYTDAKDKRVSVASKHNTLPEWKTWIKEVETLINQLIKENKNGTLYS